MSEEQVIGNTACLFLIICMPYHVLSCLVASTGATAAFTTEKLRLKYQPWAYTTVECYGCKDCSYLPTNTLLFSGMSGAFEGKDIPFVWRAYVSPNPICAGTKAHVTSSSTVSYTFQ